MSAWDRAARRGLRGVVHVWVLLSAVPDLRSDPATRARSGPLIRRDWLEKVKMQAPETLDQWRELLRVSKTTSFGTPGSGADYPFFILSYEPWMSDELAVPYFFDSNAFSGAYGLSHGFAKRGSTMVYDPSRPEYRQVLGLLAEWFREGLIHPSIVEPGALWWWNVLQVLPKCGAWIGGTDAASYLKPLSYVAAPLPRLDARAGAFLGPSIPSAYTGARSAAVSATSPHRREAVRWLDLAYGEWGSRPFNFGIEGSTYVLRQGAPVLSKDAAAEVARGVSLEGVDLSGVYQYSRGVLGGPFDLSAGLYRQHLEALMPESSAVAMAWSAGSYVEPLSLLGINATAEERPPGVFGAIREHTHRNVLDFISGRRSITEFDRFVAELEELGLPQALEILQREDRARQSRQPVLR